MRSRQFYKALVLGPWEALVLHGNCGTSHSISKLGFREEMGSYLDIGPEHWARGQDFTFWG